MYQATKKIILGSCAFRQPFAETHCKFLHGYNLYAKFYFKSTSLDINGWVIDFGAFKELKISLRGLFDHTTVIRSDDPHLEVFKKLNDQGIIDLRIQEAIGIEAFAKTCYELANDWLSEEQEGIKKVWCYKVEVFEHELKSAIYKGMKE